MIRKRIGEILVEMKAVTPEQVDTALIIQKEKGGRIGEVLMGMKVLAEADLLKALSFQLDIPYYEDIDVDEVETTLIADLSINLARVDFGMPVLKLIWLMLCLAFFLSSDRSFKSFFGSIGHPQDI